MFEIHFLKPKEYKSKFIYIYDINSNTEIDESNFFDE